MKPKILCSLDLSGAPEAVRLLENIGELTILPPIRKSVLDLVESFDAYLASAAIVVDKEFINKAKKLKVIGSPSTGTDHIDLDALSKAKIKLFDISKEYELINTFTATSELAFGLILALIRKIIPASSEANKGNWARENFSGFQLSGKTLGILGLGRLGKISAKIGLGFGMKVIANDIADSFYDGVKMVDFNYLMSNSDILTIHVHLNDKTRGMINKSAFSLMKKSAILINTSRGAIIDESELLTSLKSEKIAGAGIDIIDGEWLASNEIYEHRLIDYARENQNLIITPHIGGSTKESIAGARIFIAKKIATWLTNSQKKFN